MQFNARFFLAAIILSLAMGLLSESYMFVQLWLRITSIETYQWFYLISSALHLALGVFVVFAIMYTISRNISSELVSSSILSVFFGCWIGEAAAFASGQVIQFLNNGHYGWPFTTPLWIAWSLISNAFSMVFFVSMAAILWAYYRRGARRSLDSHLGPPPEMGSQA